MRCRTRLASYFGPDHQGLRGCSPRWRRGTTWLTFSPDGRLIAGAGPGLIVHLWEVESGRLTRHIRGAVYPPFGAAFVNGGTELRVAAGEGFDRGYLLDPEDMVELARSLAPGGLTEAEHERYFGG
ncbi:MAG: hypothetical protein ABFR89_12655 [Actinomycetota bacterium]